MSTEHTSVLHDLLRLQVLVLALGESKNFDWWKCSFLSPTGISFLQRLYPRAYFWNAVQSASVAAKIIHDLSIGRGSVFHLFRLPREVDRELRETIHGERVALMDEFTPQLGNRTKLIESLLSLAVEQRAKTQPGPIKIGTKQDILKTSAISGMALLYSAGFTSGIKTFPYFEGTGPDK